jgi:hypothetical protein
MSNLSLFLFGSFNATLDGELLERFRTNKVQALLIYLAAEPATSQKREELLVVRPLSLVSFLCKSTSSLIWSVSKPSSFCS